MKKPIQKYIVFAAIDIGSYSIRMKISEARPDGSIITLDTPKRFINLGKDTFITGMVKFENIEEICSILNGFKIIASEYGTDTYKVVATSSLREAKNCDYILDYIFQRTGFNIEVISESEERFYTYSSIADKLKEFTNLKQEGVLITDVGSGGVEITLFNKGDLIFTQYIKMGALRLKEILSDLESKTLNFPNLIGEFIESEMDTLKVLLTQYSIKNFLVIGTDIYVMHNILRDNKKEYNRSYITKEAFYSLYQQIIGKPQQYLIEKFLLNAEDVETLVPAMLMYETFLSFTHSDKIYTPEVSLCDGLVRYMVDKKFSIKNKAFSDKDIITSVKKLGERYSYDNKHAKHVEQIALQLFDSSKKLHGYSEKERLLLQIASIAHDFGKYINIKEHNVLSHDIILNSDILGFSREDKIITANIIRYHANNKPSMDDTNYKSLDYSTRIMISKLAAYLKIADSLDRSHKQKLSGFKINLNDHSFVIKAETKQDALLEEWEFKNKSILFEEVYGIKPNLIINRN